MVYASQSRRYFTYSCRVATYTFVLIVHACVFRDSINVYRVIFLGRAHLFIRLYGYALGPVYRFKNGFFRGFLFLGSMVLPCALPMNFSLIDPQTLARTDP